VFLFHAFGASGRFANQLNVGVTIFFVISGFLLYRPFVAARLGTGPAQRVRDYARRRVLRIVPAYWLTLIVLNLTVGLVGVSDRPWVFLLFAQCFSAADVFHGIPAAWSLSVEAAFYVCLPAYVIAVGLIMRRRPNKPLRTEVLGLTLLGIGAVVFRIASHVELPHSVIWWASLPGNGLWFVLGMALAVASVARETTAGARPTTSGRLPAQACWAAGALLFLTLAAKYPVGHFDPLNVQPGGDVKDLAHYVAVGAIAVALVAPAVLAEDAGAIGRLLVRPSVSWLGLISYGIFLWHQPLIDSGDRRADGIIGAAVLTIAVAAVSFYVVERPLLRYKR
jgi:peptidoglycan/LPS O-acetylase OafA/YrhL